MFWYSTGWWWWWLAFVVIFFLIPLGYGWGYRGWGPWYRRRRHYTGGPGEGPMGRTGPGDEPDSGWGALAIVLWFVLIVAAIWFIAAWGWGRYY